MKNVLYRLYSTVVTGGYLALRPFAFLLPVLGGGYGYRLSQRFAWYPEVEQLEGLDRQTVWIHASSVGEIQAALVLISVLSNEQPALHFVVTSMTEQGNKVARRRLPAHIPCLLAPLDVPLLVRRALRRIQPDMYVCLETELWPAMLIEARKAKVVMVLLNGRMSERSYQRYRKAKALLRDMLGGFSMIGAITSTDSSRFEGLGVEKTRVRVCGNVKYGLQHTGDPQATKERYQRLLQVEGETVFICGSTHTGEEALLLSVYEGLRQQGKDILWVIAPRHLERLPQVEQLLADKGIGYDTYTTLEHQSRRHQVVLVDCMGELADIYSTGDYIFCGGSLVDKGGHNIMEVIRWGRPVYFGPNMRDFADAVAMVKSAGAGFSVKDAAGLSALINKHMSNTEAYSAACRSAKQLAAGQEEAVGRQTEIIRSLCGQ